MMNAFTTFLVKHNLLGLLKSYLLPSFLRLSSFFDRKEISRYGQKKC